MTKIAIIGGSGLTEMDELKIVGRKNLGTPYGQPSTTYTIGQINNVEIVFQARHGDPHTLPPHKINYRANIWGLQQLGVKQIIAVAAVGGISAELYPGRIAIPEQIIDYTYGRQHTFFEDDLEQVTHIDFTHPYDNNLRLRLIAAAEKIHLDIYPGGVYGATQGPRLETAAEILRMQQDNCDLVGMTGMPEAALSRELNLGYANCSVVSNWAAGKSDSEISMDDIKQNLQQGMIDMAQLLKAFLSPE